MKPKTDAEPPEITAEEFGKQELGRRRIDLIWERTQAAIAISVTVCDLLTHSIQLVTNGGADHSVLDNAFFLVIGFYFGRTNHEKRGGIVSEKR